jgi:hypothetical protein
MKSTGVNIPSLSPHDDAALRAALDYIFADLEPSV